MATVTQLLREITDARDALVTHSDTAIYAEIAKDLIQAERNLVEHLAELAEQPWENKKQQKVLMQIMPTTMRQGLLHTIGGEAGEGRQYNRIFDQARILWNFAKKTIGNCLKSQYTRIGNPMRRFGMKFGHGSSRSGR